MGARLVPIPGWLRMHGAATTGCCLLAGGSKMAASARIARKPSIVSSCFPEIWHQHTLVSGAVGNPMGFARRAAQLNFSTYSMLY